MLDECGLNMCICEAGLTMTGFLRHQGSAGEKVQSYLVMRLRERSGAFSSDG